MSSLYKDLAVNRLGGQGGNSLDVKAVSMTTNTLSNPATGLSLGVLQSNVVYLSNGTGVVLTLTSGTDYPMKGTDGANWSLPAGSVIESIVSKGKINGVTNFSWSGTPPTTLGYQVNDVVINDDALASGLHVKVSANNATLYQNTLDVVGGSKPTGAAYALNLSPVGAGAVVLNGNLVATVYYRALN
jgi:hypothetical protein